MKTIGLLGGMSWESTSSYYTSLNRGINGKLGGLHSAKIILHSFDFALINKIQHAGDWDQTAEILSQAALGVEAAGADFLLICTNTMHKVAPQIESRLNIPILHLADATASILVGQGIKKVGLLGTAFTMEEGFYKDRFTENYNMEVITPHKEDRKIVHQTIYQELCKGEIRDQSKKEYLRIIKSLAQKGAEGVILGCTEIGLLVNQKDTNVPLFDTTAIHVDRAIDYALN
ncbi:MAG: aspartate/glutamate racemase family protein [Proteobacteria bacterium]|nr:aspartate/glutamate racemase family protein [Pseudomonadota bacterium]